MAFANCLQIDILAGQSNATWVEAGTTKGHHAAKQGNVVTYLHACQRSLCCTADGACFPCRTQHQM